MSYHLICGIGCGSAIVEAALVLSGLPFTIEDTEYWNEGPSRERLLSVNPLGQVPVLQLPDGQWISESAAMLLHLGDVSPEAGLVPPAGHPARARFLHWLQFLVCAIYPTFTYGDDPARWVGSEATGRALKQSTDEHRKRLWVQLEHQLGDGSWCLGDSFSALDLYLTVMSQWRPGRDWFAGNCPKIAAIAARGDAIAALVPVWQRNFSDS